MSSMREAVARDRAYWLLDAVATATQDRRFLRGDPEYDEVAGGAILANGKKAIVVALAKAMQPEIDRRVAEERAKLLERLREPTSEMVRRLNAACDTPDVQMAWVFPYIATLLAEAFQQENSDGR